MGLSGTDLKLGQKLQKNKKQKKQRNKTQKNLNFEFLS